MRKLYPFQEEGVHFLKRRQACLLADEMGTGKAQPLDEPVLTPNGWRPIGSLQVGDVIFSVSGKLQLVIGVFPQGKLPSYKVTMTDGSWTICSGNHLWRVATANDRYLGKSKVLDLVSIAHKGLHDINGNHRFFIPMAEPFEVEEKALEINPYVLGALLADGHLGNKDKTGSLHHSGGEEKRFQLAKEMPEDLSLKKVNEITSRLSKIQQGPGANSLVTGLREYGLWGARSYEKFIPQKFLWASINQRIALLQGLCDGDGTASEDGYYSEYNTTSKQLAEDVVHLVQSLGGTPRWKTRIPTYDYKGQHLYGRMDHRISLRLPSSIIPFRHCDKKARFKPKTKYPPARAITSIEDVGEIECVCISVDSYEKLYITRNFIVTHNTIQTLTAAHQLPGSARSVVIVSPKAVKSVWKEEASLVNRLEAHWHQIGCYSGRESFVWPQAGRVSVTGYEILPPAPPEGAKDKYGNLLCEAPPAFCWFCKGNGRETLIGDAIRETGCHVCNGSGKRPAPTEKTVLIFDEAHRLKNRKTKAWKAAKALADAVLESGGRVWLVTATPLLNRPTELRDVLAVAGLDEVLWSCYEEFMMAFNGRYERIRAGARIINTVVFDKQPIAEPWVKDRLKKICIRRTREEVLPELPKKTVQDIHVESDTTYPLLKKLAEELEKKKWDGEAETLEKISVGEISKTRCEIAKRKALYALALCEEAEEAEEPIVVFSAHQAPLETFRNRPGWRIITGQTSADERAEFVRDFQAGLLKGIALTVIAGGVGITLTRACQAVFIDLSWTPSLNSQAEDRLARIGQTRPVLIRRVVVDHPIEKRLYEILSRKQILISSIWGENANVQVDCEARV